MKSLRKQAQEAPKFILVSFHPETGGYIFIADSNKCKETMSVNKKHALEFSYGFDDETIKEKAWSLATGFEFMALAN